MSLSPLPPMITLGDSRSFAVEDLKSQAERVITIILKNNKMPSCLIKKLLTLQKNILKNSEIDHLKTGDDICYWNKTVFLKKNPHWFDNNHHGLIISYFHRLILDKIDYFESGLDPYLEIKRQALVSYIKKQQEYSIFFNIEKILMGMLWGNKADLVPPTISAKKMMIADDRSKLINFLIKRKAERIDIIADNFGEELFFDLLFINYLFDHKLVKLVRYHVKNYPYNITDTTKQDFFWALDFLTKAKNKKIKLLADNINKLILEKKVKIITYPFTTLGLDRVKAMNVVNKQYNGSSLLITKGDFNYRKNLGWYYWETEDSYEEIMSYLKLPTVSFRVVKNEILVGAINKRTINFLNKNNPNWWKNGCTGMIKFLIPTQLIQKSNKFLTEGQIDNYWAE